MRVIGISCITNAAAVFLAKLTLEEVTETADSVRPQFADLLAAGVQHLNLTKNYFNYEEKKLESYDMFS